MEEKTIDMALFPLGIFLLPGERTPLHIFEPRYRKMFDEIEKEGLDFGIPYSTGRTRHTHGARCRLVKVTKRYPTGESDVLVECTGIFRLKDFKESSDDRLYPFGTVEMMSDLEKWVVSEEVGKEYTQYVGAMQESKLPFGHPSGDAFVPILSSLNMMSSKKFALIRIADAKERDNSLLNAIRFSRMLVEQENAVENGVYLS